MQLLARMRVGRSLARSDRFEPYLDFFVATETFWICVILLVVWLLLAGGIPFFVLG
ncbi:hypothetical protein [Coleofasciculus sp. H7-2]|uniref:hypothetical protein n=1 Tax=Coleofasciculus sp. H7-2 TaxID=3351545 RepID=UPI00367314C7